jgi:hypothetical protein
MGPFRTTCWVGTGGKALEGVIKHNSKHLPKLARQGVALFLCEILVLLPLSPGATQSTNPAPQPEPLRSYLQKSYLELFELAPSLHFTAEEIKKQRESLAKGEETCVNRFKEHVKRYQKQIDAARADLKKNTANMSSEPRKAAHCKIQNLDLLRSEAEILARHAIPTAYDNLSAKLDFIEKMASPIQANATGNCF